MLYTSQPQFIKIEPIIRLYTEISVRLLPRKIMCCGWPGRINLGKRAITILYFKEAPPISHR
ncbi:hypothetical protein SQ11_12295 [Nitrosospira sp. NpAV]|nr:hypothetical protein SQ11_12295 [Nitrosospira sp. NpAV]